MQKDKYTKVNGPPKGGLVAKNKGFQTPQNPVSILGQQLCMVDAVELSNDNARHGNLAKERIRLVLGLGLHPQSIFAADIRRPSRVS